MDRSLLQNMRSNEILQQAFLSYQTQYSFGHLDPNNQEKFNWMSYGEVNQMATPLAAALAELYEGSNRAFLTIMAENRLEWYLTDYACVFSGIPTAPIHLGLDTEAICYILERTEAIYAVTSNKCFDMFRKAIDLKGKFNLKGFIFMDKTTSDENQSYISGLGMSTLFLHDMIEAGKSKPFQLATLQDNDIVTLMFTSGSTGIPKGVIFDEKSIRRILRRRSAIWRPAVSVSYMPLAHAMQREGDWINVTNGGRIALFETDMSHLFEVVRAARPTTFAAVPAVWNMLYSNYKEQVEAALIKNTDDDKDVESIEREVLKKFEKVLGDRLRVMEAGGAPVSDKVRHFIVKCFPNAIYREGYGATETGGIGSGYTSTLSTRAEVSYRLKDVPELGYFSEDRPHPRGELWVKSADTVPGYFKDPVATSAAFDEDGYFCTGDIVEMDTSNDTIKIIDRRKHFFKLAQGEYVAPERLEKVFLLSPLVRFIYIYAESVESYVLAVVVPQQPVLEAWATKQGLQFASFEELCQNPAAVAEVMKSLSILADDPNNKILPFELPRGILLEPEPFTAENELLTSTFKLKRLNLQRKYKSIMREMYDNINERMLRTRIDELRALIAKHLSTSTNPLPTEETSVPLTEWGLDSLSAIRLSNVIKSEFGVTVAPENLATGKTSFDSLVKLVTNQQASSSSISSNSESFTALYKPQKQTDWKAAVSLDSAISDGLKSLPRVDPFSKSLKVENVFLTGATGFLGVFLLAEIIKSTNWKIHCLVRAKSETAANSRMREVMLKMLVDTSESDVDALLSTRISTVHGDLALPQFGLSDDVWANLAKSIDLIVHNGCRVNTVFSYDALEAENVGGTRSCLHLASQKHAKPFVYISTLSAIGPMMDPDLDGREFVDQTFDARLLQMMGGYGSTKRVSELLVDQARKCGLPTMIVRPGTIGPHSKTGACNLSDYHTKLLCGITQIACAPESKQRLDMIPVDYLARFVIGLVRKNIGWSEVFHAYEEAAAPTMIEVAECIIKRHSNVRMLSFAAWRSKLQQHAASEDENALYPLLHYFNGMDLPGLRGFSKAKFNMHLQRICLSQRLSHECLSIN
eukprot:TRINITY_DN4062_c0_g1_i1.p1 TRINITY_DN4062_c0_g1~~TRINITY_DN4062_c0_g1_i1.p1  ORF type:complete len:1092 (-),score=158.97 TRINITY_DN4062_c0_g1_i1:110-3385(-)